MPAPTLSDAALETLRDAVRIAKDEQVRRLSMLRARLVARGHSRANIDAALLYWSCRVQATL